MRCILKSINAEALRRTSIADDYFFAEAGIVEMTGAEEVTESCNGQKMPYAVPVRATRALLYRTSQGETSRIFAVKHYYPFLVGWRLPLSMPQLKSIYRTPVGLMPLLYCSHVRHY